MPKPICHSWSVLSLLRHFQSPSTLWHCSAASHSSSVSLPTAVTQRRLGGSSQVTLAGEDLPPHSPSEALTWVLSSRRLSCSSPLPGTAKLVTELLLADEWHLQNPKWFSDMKKDFFMPSVQDIGNYQINENLGSFLPNPNWFKDKPFWKSNARMRGSTIGSKIWCRTSLNRLRCGKAHRRRIIFTHAPWFSSPFI